MFTRLFAPFRKKSKATRPSAPPRHIAIVMDGNGRWARRRGLPRVAGHKVGAETFRKIATYCKDIGVDYLTVYAFSTENWKRAKEEVDAIFSLLENYLHEAIEKMAKDQIRMQFFGDTSALPEKLQQLIRETEKISRTLEGFQVNICLNYGGRAEILRAVEKAISLKEQNSAYTCTEESFSQLLYSKHIPDPELVIRPSGEYRLSNFLLWQTAYSEFYFTDTLWPAFETDDLDKAIEAYHQRDRRFGGVKGQ